MSEVSLLLPPGNVTDFDQVSKWVQLLAAETGVRKFWVRDVPVVDDSDTDAGSLLDPFAYAVALLRDCPDIERLGVAAISAGSRHPVVVARAAASVVDLGGRPFELAIGPGGKPNLNRIYGLEPEARDQVCVDAVTEVAATFSGTAGSDRVLRRPRTQETPPLWITTGRADLFERLLPCVDGWLMWASSPSKLAGLIDPVKAHKQTLRVAAAIHLYVHSSVQRPSRTDPPLSALRLPPAALAELIETYHDVGVDEVILSLPIADDPEGQVDALRAALRDRPA